MDCRQLNIRFGVLLLLSALAMAGRQVMAAEPVELRPYNFLEVRQGHATKLKHRGPAPQKYRNVDPPPGVEKVVYVSAGRKLWGWLAMPEGAKGQVPGVVYAHGGFSFAAAEFEVTLPFLRAGYAVFAPTLRGENGNPGVFEFFYGEVDDLANAVRFLAAHPKVRPDRVYAFGHSVGGGLVALMALFPNVPVRASGGASGLWLPESFPHWRKSRIRFSLADPLESELRSMLPHMDELAHPHLAFMSREEWQPGYARRVNAQARRVAAPFAVTVLEGGHNSILFPAIRRFAAFIGQDLE